jgi:hypothetical protein
MSERRVEVLRAVYRVTKWKDGCVFQTEFVENRWVSAEESHGRPADLGKDGIFASVPTSYEGQTIRSVRVDG